MEKSEGCSGGGGRGDEEIDGEVAEEVGVDEEKSGGVGENGGGERSEGERRQV